MKVFIHLGIHKTGSTYLQKKVFPQISDIQFIPRKKLLDFKNYILNSDDLYFDSNEALNLFLKEIDSNGNEKVLISDEEFYGHPFMGGQNRTRNLHRLHWVFKQFNPKFIIVFREQKSLIDSLYLQFIKTGGYVHKDHFLKSNRYPLIVSTKFFVFDKYIEDLNLKCSKNNILTLFYEDFRLDKKGFIDQLLKFVGSRSYEPNSSEEIINSSLSPYFLGVSIFLNKLSKSYKNPNGLFPFYFYQLYMKFILTISKLVHKQKGGIVKWDKIQEREVKNSNQVFAEIKSIEWLNSNKYLD